MNAIILRTLTSVAAACGLAFIGHGGHHGPCDRDHPKAQAGGRPD